MRVASLLLLLALATLAVLGGAMGMGMADCPACVPGGDLTGFAGCAAVLWLAALAHSMLSTRLARAESRLSPNLLARDLDPPPRGR